jgi:hypothetical protein
VRRLVRIVRPRHILCLGFETERYLQPVFRHWSASTPVPSATGRGVVRRSTARLTARSRRAEVCAIPHPSNWRFLKAADRDFMLGYVTASLEGLGPPGRMRPRRSHPNPMPGENC